MGPKKKALEESTFVRMHKHTTVYRKLKKDFARGPYLPSNQEFPGVAIAIILPNVILQTQLILKGTGNVVLVAGTERGCPRDRGESSATRSSSTTTRAVQKFNKIDHNRNLST